MTANMKSKIVLILCILAWVVPLTLAWIVTRPQVVTTEWSEMDAQFVKRPCVKETLLCPKGACYGTMDLWVTQYQVKTVYSDDSIKYTYSNRDDQIIRDCS